MKPTRIILHHSLTKDSKTVSWGAIRRYHTQFLGWDDIGYHYGIEAIGQHYEILIGRMLNIMGAHCRGHNGNSVGICFIGNFDLAAPPKAQWDLGVKLVKGLIEILDMPPFRILGHNNYDSNKSCPGKYFDITKFVKDVTDG